MREGSEGERERKKYINATFMSWRVNYVTVMEHMEKYVKLL